MVPQCHDEAHDLWPPPSPVVRARATKTQPSLVPSHHSTSASTHPVAQEAHMQKKSNISWWHMQWNKRRRRTHAAACSAHSRVDRQADMRPLPLGRELLGTTTCNPAGTRRPRSCNCALGPTPDHRHKQEMYARKGKQEMYARNEEPTTHANPPTPATTRPGVIKNTCRAAATPAVCKHARKGTW